MKKILPECHGNGIAFRGRAAADSWLVGVSSAQKFSEGRRKDDSGRLQPDCRGGGSKQLGNAGP